MGRGWVVGGSLPIPRHRNEELRREGSDIDRGKGEWSMERENDIDRRIELALHSLPEVVFGPNFAWESLLSHSVPIFYDPAEAIQSGHGRAGTNGQSIH